MTVQFTTLFSFNGYSNGSEPVAGLTTDANGNLFGTTEGGLGSPSTVFKIQNTGTVAAPIYASAPTTLALIEGDPKGGLTADANGNLFGTTTSGGGGYGTVFEMKNAGTVAAPVYTSGPTTLVSFDRLSNGEEPFAGLTADANGNLFGTTSQEGVGGAGTVFEIQNIGTVTAPAYASVPITLVSFNGPNGAYPSFGRLTVNANGDLFGTTQEGGANNKGMVFEIQNTGTVAAPVYASAPTTLVSFNGYDGANPYAGLIADAAGDLFGTTEAGGTYGYGTVFEIQNTGAVAAPVYASAPITLVSFNSSNGANPYAGLTADANGDLFGTTEAGGTYGYGTVFEIQNTGAVAAPVYASAPITLVSFNSSNGANPYAGLTADATGNLLGTTFSGGANGGGTVFEITALPTVSGTIGGQTTTSEAPIKPFAHVTIGDANANATDMLTITLGGAGGTLSGTGLSGGTGGVYTLSGTAAAITSELDALVFTPKAGAPNTTSTTTFTLSDLSSAGGAPIVDSTTSVIDNDPAVAPTISGTVSGQTTTSETPARPFAHATIGDANANATETLTITLGGAGGTLADGTGFSSLTTVGSGVYRLSGTAAAITSELDALIFTPKAGAPNTSSTTAFTLSDQSSAGGGPAVDTTTTVMDKDIVPTVGASLSGILWQNSSGQAAIWDMNGNNVVGGGTVSSNPGPSWHAIGTGDFYDNGHSDILWQNANGQAAIWEMNGTSISGGGTITSNPGPSWKAVGTGDFNDDGHSDILFQNASSGQVAIWEMNGTSISGGGTITSNPGPSWKAVGTGDFNDDGHSDILFQNASSGQVAIWEMNGTNIIGGGTVTSNPGASWKAIGTGDFNDDGHSDILWQNADGQVAIWEMNGDNVIGGGTVSANPGPSWHAIGTGGGGSDILFQNTSGQTAIWDMNGTNIVAGGIVSANAGPSWHAIIDFTLTATATSGHAIAVSPVAPTLAPVAETGVEGSAIALDLGASAKNLAGDSNSLATLTISAIPVGATLSDGVNTFTATAGSTSVSVLGWSLSSLTITPLGDADFSLSVSATQMDSQGRLSAATTATEAIAVSPVAPTLAPVAETGVEGSAIALDLGASAKNLAGDSNSLATLTISAIPVGATLSDGVNTFTATAGSTSVSVLGWSLSSLTITPLGDADFSLSVSATQMDSQGRLSAATTATEAIAVSPVAPTLAPVAETGVEGSAIALDLGASAKNLAGDSNSLATLTISDIPGGATLSDGVNTFTATAGSTSVSVLGWSLSSLTITPLGDADFSLSVSATQMDSQGRLSAATTATEAIAVSPVAPTLAPVAETGVEGSAIALDLGASAKNLAGDSNSLATLTISAIPVGATLSDGVNTFTATAGSTSVSVLGWSLSSLTITPLGDADFSLSVSATQMDSQGRLSAATTATEAIAVSPVAPTLAPVAETGVEGSAIALDLGASAKNLAGDSNSLATLTISDIPGGATLSDGVNTFTATAGSTSVSVLGWSLSSLTITPLGDADFSLSVSATQMDSQGRLSAATTATEAIAVSPAAPTLAPVAETGVEGSAIALDLGASAKNLAGDSNSLATLTISDIPVGATLSDGVNTFTATAGSTSVSVLGWSLSSLTITPLGDADFSLSVSATQMDSQGRLSAATTATEAIAVSPAAPTLAPVAETGVEGSAIALDLGASAKNLAGDSNSLATLTISDIPVGATLSDGVNTFTATAGSTSVSVLGWSLSSLTITPLGDADFSLSVSATQMDSQGRLSAATTATEAIAVSPVAPPSSTVIESSGSMSLMTDGVNYLLQPNGGSAVELSLGGTPVVVGQLGASTPIAAQQTATGYEVALANVGGDLYTVWDTDSSGNVVSAPIGNVSGTSAALESMEVSFNDDLNGDGTIGVPVPSNATLIESSGTTSLLAAGNTYLIQPNGNGAVELSQNGAPVTAGQFTGWIPIAAQQTATGYQVAWRIPGADQYWVWNTDASGNYVSGATGVVSGETVALESLETSFQQDLNGDGTIGIPPPTVIESFGSTSLLKSGSSYLLAPNGGATVQLSYGGAPATVGQFGSWTPIGAEQTTTGYEVAWSEPGADQYWVWNTDENGNYVSDGGVVAGESATLMSLETSFQQDLNGDGTIGVPPPKVIESSGSMNLVTDWINYLLEPNGGSAVKLSLGGTPVVVGQLGASTPIAAQQTATGYEVALANVGGDLYTVWDTDSSGNVVSTPIGNVSGTSAALESMEVSFNDDLNGDGTIGVPVPSNATVIGSSGTASLLAAGNTYLIQPNGNGAVELSQNGAPVTAGQFTGWIPIAAQQTATGYQVAWRIPGADQYWVWNTDASGNYVSGATGVVSGETVALESLETSFQQDLNGDGTIGVPPPTVIESFGSTSLLKSGSSYLLAPNGGATVQLSYGGAPVTAGQFGSWTPIGAEQTATGYEVAWSEPGADQYWVWNTDENGNYVSDGGVVAGESATLMSLETSFQQDLNGDGTIGVPPPKVIESSGSMNLVTDWINYLLEPNGGSAVKLSLGGTPVVVGQLGASTPIAAQQTATGYEVALANVGASQYTVWDTDSSGNVVSAPIGNVSGTSAALESMEVSFNDDLNGDGTIGIPVPSNATVIGSSGTASLLAAGNTYLIQPNGVAGGVALSYGGAPVTAGQFGSWTPIAAQQTATGYGVAWRVPGADQYWVWNTDSSGNYVSDASGIVSGTSAALESFETSFNEDLNNDGVIGAPSLSNQPLFSYQGTDANGAQLYDVTWNVQGSHPFAVRVLVPQHPSSDYAHSFLYALPVESGLTGHLLGDGIDQLASLDVEDQYNATIIEPIFPMFSWYADNPNDATVNYETFVSTILPQWVDSHFSTTGDEKNLLIGFSKSGYGDLDLLFKHPTVFDAAAAFDFPADMQTYDGFGSSSANDYGTQANFQNNYEMDQSFLNAYKAPFTTQDRIWISEGPLFAGQVADFDSLLTSQGIMHTLSTTETKDPHSWTSGWLSTAVAGLYGLEKNLNSGAGA